MTTFCKTTDCPRSQDLLAFQNFELATEESSQIEAHIEFCEFCRAEVEFYSNYPQGDANVPKVEIPIPLYQLAKALLRKEPDNATELNRLLNTDESLALNKA